MLVFLFRFYLPILSVGAVLVAWIRIEGVIYRAAKTNEQVRARRLVMTGVLGGAMGAGAAGFVIGMAPEGGAMLYIPFALVFGTIPGAITGWLIAEYRARNATGDVHKAD